MKSIAKVIYILLIALIIFPFNKIDLPQISAPVALFLGLVFAFSFENPCPKFNKKTSKYLLQIAVVCLGFNMNLHESLKSGSEGMLFTVVSVIGVMFLGVLLGYWLHINRKTAYLISSGTARGKLFCRKYSPRFTLASNFILHSLYKSCQVLSCEKN